MAITKKDFIILAEQAKKCKKIMREPRDWYYSIAFQSVGFSAINPNFKLKTYMEASGADLKDQAQIIAMYRLMGGL